MTRARRCSSSFCTWPCGSVGASAAYMSSQACAASVAHRIPSNVCSSSHAVASLTNSCNIVRSRRCCVPSSARGVRNASCGSRGSGFGDDRAMRCAGDVPGGFGGVDDACAAVFSASFWKGDDAALLRLLGVAGDGRGIYVCEACSNVGVQAVCECRPARAIQRWQSRILAQFTSVGVDRVRRMSCAAHAANMRQVRPST